MHRNTSALLLLLLMAVTPAAETTSIAIIVGPNNHPAGTHEALAGGRLLKQCLETSSNVAGISVSLFDRWPDDTTVLDSISSFVFLGDNFPLAVFPNRIEVLKSFAAHMQRGAGIACIHFATGLPKDAIPPDGDHPLLTWLGGYFAGRAAHHQSFARIFPSATISPAANGHPILRGWSEFTLHDEPYTNMYFGPGDNQPSPNVTVIAESTLPPDAPKREIVAWCIQRPDRGRGFGVVMPHFYKNWQNSELRRMILNGIVWSSNREVPVAGVDSENPDLARFMPGAIEPPPKQAPPK